MQAEYEKDPAKRIGLWFYPAIQLGGIMGLHDMYIRTQCKTALHALQRIGYYVLPMGGLGFTLPAMTLVSEGIRGKRDPLNYFVGGLSCLPILKQWLNLPPFMVRNGILLVALSVTIYGICEDNDGVHLPTTEHIRAKRLLVYDK
ncbi:uncharacterized protein LOC143359061 [Halictus rubicundus]|uniref:uncharacterized protein LOC143359061 n=1 Tax=Halictus rubicundus TaxID=77578 RepID=UPI0040354E56